MYPLLETIKIVRGVPVNLEWHRRRMERSFREYWGTDPPYTPDDILQPPAGGSGEVLKARLLYGKDGYEVHYSVYRKKEVRSLKLVRADRLDYSLKYADRRPLEQLLQQREGCDEILIVKKGLVTDTSYSNLVFFDGYGWYTPSSPLLRGTCRERMLADGSVRECRIRPSDLASFLGYKLINAMLDPEEEPMLPVSSIGC